MTIKIRCLLNLSLKRRNLCLLKRLRYLLLRIISDSQWRRMRSWLERRFAAAYVSRINRIWMGCIVVFLFSVFIVDLLPEFNPAEPTTTIEKSGKGTPAPVVVTDAPPGATGGDPALAGKPVQRKTGVRETPVGLAVDPVRPQRRTEGVGTRARREVGAGR